MVFFVCSVSTYNLDYSDDSVIRIAMFVYNNICTVILTNKLNI